MIALIDLQEAKDRLNIVHTDADADIQSMILQASAIAMMYGKLLTIPESWASATSPDTYIIPDEMKAATLLMVCEMYYNREASVANILSDAVKSLIERVPTLA